VTADRTTGVDHTDRVLVGLCILLVALTMRYVWIHVSFDMIRPYLIVSVWGATIPMVAVGVSWVIGYLVYDIPGHVMEWVKYSSGERETE